MEILKRDGMDHAHTRTYVDDFFIMRTHTRIRLLRVWMTDIHIRIRLLYYGVATISRLLKITGLFCRIQSLLQGSFAKETCNFQEPINCGHPI